VLAHFLVWHFLFGLHSLSCYFLFLKGNGNAAIFRDDSRVFTFSVHCAQNLFSAKEFSDCDVELAAGCSDDEYLEMLDSKLDEVLSSLLD
jgi:acetoin utilization deacetylase AcuC-like enzyme